MGGLDRCLEIRLGLLRRLAATTVQAEMLEARMAEAGRAWMRRGEIFHTRATRALP